MKPEQSRLAHARDWLVRGEPREDCSLFQELLGEAQRVGERAWSPYSRLRIGAALVGNDGRVYAGCNVESASFGLTICAERSAVFQGVAGGASHFLVGVLVGSGDEPILPCGACRQVLHEFGQDLLLVCVGALGGRVTRKLAQLLPDAMDGKDVPLQ